MMQRDGSVNCTVNNSELLIPSSYGPKHLKYRKRRKLCLEFRVLEKKASVHVSSSCMINNLFLNSYELQ
jgi:hypothetical protein